ncbi:hypothetical protein E2562_020317 [Oryza meyeriana var. granulata]|uniref:Uncharacterized protein n=1 Tax=Oryza meyeriana var. granulata TaxID=110450 RepID=A0A6G1E9R1_9ORYZ|nr:hypothetical protein E2562_020317 [Oryza meyeriana var. granulata]
MLSTTLSNACDLREKRTIQCSRNRAVLRGELRLVACARGEEERCSGAAVVPVGGAAELSREWEDSR